MNILDKLGAIVKLKSKTINITAIAATVVLFIKNQWGIEVPTEVVVAVFTVLAFALRMITEKPLELK